MFILTRIQVSARIETNNGLKVASLTGYYWVIQDSISVHPNAFGLEPEVAVKDSINDKYVSRLQSLATTDFTDVDFGSRYANKLIPGVGLALSVYDVLTCTEGTVRYGDGLIWYKSEIHCYSGKITTHRYRMLILGQMCVCLCFLLSAIFRAVVFSPTIGEIMVGKVLSSSPNHIRCECELDNAHLVVVDPIILLLQCLSNSSMTFMSPKPIFPVYQHSESSVHWASPLLKAWYGLSALVPSVTRKERRIFISRWKNQKTAKSPRRPILLINQPKVRSRSNKIVREPH